jgi:hypothetical protein
MRQAQHIRKYRMLGKITLVNKGIIKRRPILRTNSISRIARQAVRKIGEWDYVNNVSLGNCKPISEEILRHLRASGYKTDKEAQIIYPLIEDQSGGFHQGHVAVYLPKQRILVDTQLWQYTNGKPTFLKTRRILFRGLNYKKILSRLKRNVRL